MTKVDRQRRNVQVIVLAQGSVAKPLGAAQELLQSCLIQRSLAS
jgi:hypothetical protein